MVSSATTSISPVDAKAYALIGRVAAGDSVAFETLYRHYTPRLLRYLLSRLGQVELAEEVCQDVWLVVWKQAPHYQARAPFSAWLFEIARRLVCKARSCRVPPAIDSPPRAETATEAESPEATLGRQTDHRRVAQAVAALPPVLRHTIRLRYEHNYTYRQIAAQMGCAEDTVKHRLRQSRRRLAVSLRRNEPWVATAG